MVLRGPNPILHAVAWLTAIATLLLIFMGGLVTSHGAGMAVPDWPNSYGYNMWLFPPSLWWDKGGIFYEHSHRLKATFVGLCTIVACVLAWKYEPRYWARWIVYGLFGFVLFQGILGGLRVLFVNLNLAVVHAITAQLFFCSAVLFVIITSKWWHRAPNLAWSADRSAGRRLILVAWVTFAIALGQLVVGAVQRHYQAGLAMYDNWLPAASAMSLQAVNDHRAFVQGLDRVSMTQVWLHFGHRVGAVAVTAAIAWLVTLVFRRQIGRSLLAVPAVTLVGLLLIQLTLGILTIYYRKPADIASLHVAVGALVLAMCFVLAVRSMRLYSRRFRASGEPIRVEVTSIGPQSFLAA